jgi:hypothetical protein
LGQASRVSGVTPAAISLLLVHLKKGRFRGFEPHGAGATSGAPAPGVSVPPSSGLVDQDAA